MKIVANGVPIEVLGRQGAVGPAGPDGNPIGTVISYMGKTAPRDYLICDGAEYPMADYPDLASFFKEQFGAENHFGGDGVTTFAVPNLTQGSDAAISCIKSAASESSGEVYSTEETVIGTWINGKPLYRSVIKKGATSSSSGWTKYFDASNLNIDELVYIYGMYHQRADNAYKPFGTTEFAIRHFPDGWLYLSGEYSALSSYMTLEYTKTTDQGGIS